MRAFFEGESDQLPRYYTEIVRRDLGDLWQWLPAGALQHDQQAYLKSSRQGAPPVATSVSEALPRQELADAGS